MDEVLSLLWRLQSMDREHAKALRERASAPGPLQRAQLAARLDESVRREKSLGEQLSRNRQAFRQTELDLRAVEERLSQNESRLYGGGVSNAKELAQLAHRVDEERASRAGLEDRYLSLMDRIEQDERKLAAARAEAEESRRSVQEFDAAQQERATREALADEDYAAERRELLGQLPEQYRDRYERVHERHPGNALVVIERGSCGGCHNSLARAEIERAVRSPGLATCENCGRLLVPGAEATTRRG